MLEKNVPFFEQYINNAISHLETYKGRSLTSEEKAKVIKKAKDNYIDNEVTLINSVKNVQSRLPLSKLIEMIIDKDAIITGYGTIYKNQHNFNSIICKLLAYFMDERKVVKKEMIKLLNSGIPKSDIRIKVLDQKQKVLKLLANSFYGAYAEKSFIFYNPDQAPSITYTGRMIIGYTLYLFETMLTDNHWFTEKDELFIYISNCISQVKGKTLDELGDNPNLPELTEIREIVAGKLLSYCQPSDSSWNPEVVVEKIISNLSDENLFALYFRGNIYHFFEYNYIAENFKSILENGEIVEADYGWLEKNYPEAIEFLNNIWSYIEDWVLSPGLVRNINQKIDVMQRKSVILTDTDSTFRE